MKKSAFTLDRRHFLGGAALTSVSLLAGSGKAAAAPAEAEKAPEKPAGCVASTCLGCNARCGVRCFVKDGRLDHVTGNPYNPCNMAGRPLAYDTPAEESLSVPSPACGKAQEAMHDCYNPIRILQPLKRTGPRGSGRFGPIPWEQLIREVADGGKLFAGIGDTTVYPGLRSVLSDDPIDPADPSLGSRRNGFIFIGGRDQAGYQDFSNRFVKDAVGSVNRISHTDICGLGFRMGNFVLTDGQDVELKADVMSCEYMLVFGVNVYEALQPGINFYGALMAERHAAGKLKFVVVDPRATNASCHADQWLPVIPGQDGALAMGMLRVMLEENLFDKDFLSCFNDAGAKAMGLCGITDSCHLVVTDGKSGKDGKKLTASDLQAGLDEKKEGAGPCVMTAPGSAAIAAGADSALLEAEGEVKLADGTTVHCATAFTLMKKAVMETSLEDYAKRCGIGAGVIRGVAREFASHGHKAAVCQYHGAGNYVGGTYASWAVAMLNVLTGSINRKGGYLRGSGSAGDWKKGVFSLTDFEGKRKTGGVRISREKNVYEKSAEYKEKKAKGGTGYPARRPWFPVTRGGLCVEAMNGIAQGYPYACQVLFTFFFNPVYSIPGGTSYVTALKDTEKVPLHVSIDVCVNESNIYADYIVPSLSWLEGMYSFMSPHAPALKFTTVRVPAIVPLTGKTADGRPFSMETFLIDLAEYLKLPGFGKDAIPGNDGKMYPLHCAEDFYVRALGNLAANCKLKEAPASETDLVRANYPVFAYNWMLPPALWRQVCTLLTRGGVFRDSYDSVFSGDEQKKGIKKILLWSEKLACSRNSITGKRNSGTLTLAPACEASGRDVTDEDREWPFTAVTYKMNVHCQSRTSCHTWALEIFPENRAVINALDARKLGIRAGDKIRITSRSCALGIVAAAEPSTLVRPGCVAISFHYGHWQMGASSLSIRDAGHAVMGGPVRADRKMGTGVSFNRLGRLDVSMGGTPLVDCVGGIPDFSSTRVKITKA